jgi:hypothetical protein
VVVGDDHRSQLRQVVEVPRHGVQPLGTDQRRRRHPVAPDRVEEEPRALDLDQRGGVAEPCQAQVVRRAEPVAGGHERHRVGGLALLLAEREVTQGVAGGHPDRRGDGVVEHPVMEVRRPQHPREPLTGGPATDRRRHLPPGAHEGSHRDEQRGSAHHISDHTTHIAFDWLSTR